MSCTHTSCVQTVPVFQGLEQPIIEHIENIVQQRQFQRDQHIFHQGDPADALYVIHRGIVKLYKLSDEGKEQTIRILFPGDFFGQSSLVMKQPQYACAQVLENTELCVVHQSNFQKAMNQHPELVLRILTAVTERLHEADEWMSSISLDEAERRLAKLLILFNKKLLDNETHFHLPFAKKELAPLIGSTRETVSRKLVAFQERGIIAMKGQRQIQIKDHHSLAWIAGQE